MKNPINRATIASQVSKITNTTRKVEAFVTDPTARPFMPANRREYSDYQRFLHEVLVQALVDSGYFESTNLHLNDLGIVTPSVKLSQQNPDLYTLRGENVDICEVTLSYNVEEARSWKLVKYNEFLCELEAAGYKPTYSVLAVDLTDPEWEDSLPRISELYLGIMRQLIGNYRHIHTDAKFAELRKTKIDSQVLNTLFFEVPEDHLLQLVEDASGARIDYDDLDHRLKTGSYEGLTDEEYIHGLARGILKAKPIPRPEPNPHSSRPIELERDWQNFKSMPPNTTKAPRVLQLGLPSVLREMAPREFNHTKLEMRITSHYGGYLDLIKSSLQVEDPSEDDHIMTLHLSQEDLEREQMQGPGRKSLLKKKGIKSVRSAPTHIGISPSHIDDVEGLMHKITSLKDVDIQNTVALDHSIMGPSMYNHMCKIDDMFDQAPMTACTRFYSRVATEIILNSMRRRKTRQYVLGWSGFDGVYFLVAPGPQLRTESNTEFVKMISYHPPVTDKLLAPWHRAGDHWESDWLSVDTDRLKHWQRACDRVKVATLTNCERLCRGELSMVNALRDEISLGNYSLLGLTYLEDRQLTSVTNQTLRYLWIKSLGDRKFDGMIAKFPSRVGSYIQSLFLQRSIKTVIEVCSTPLSHYIQNSQVRRDEETGNYDETTTGVVGLLPRLFTNGGPVPLSYNLNEIYWCMAYNKDRQNATQDSMAILTKIFKEERKFDLELAARESGFDKASYLLGTTTLSSDIKHISSMEPESHYFSYRAVLAGMRCQDGHRDNIATSSAWLTPQKVTAILTTNLSELATFKASVKTISKQVDQDDLSSIDMIGKRTKAIELVAELVESERLLTMCDVLTSLSGEESRKFEILIQIFKKNQVGGVREIIILYIKARVLFKITEDISRLLSKADRREILTKGRDKRLMMRSDYEELVREFPPGTPIQVVKNSYDKATWAQKFIPTIFIALSEVHLAEYQPLKTLFRFLFLKHCNKKMEFPKKLVEQWIKHPEAKHDEESVQLVKEKFLKDGVPYFINHSNMCQGIPHYSSTTLSLSSHSLRDALFLECIKILGQPNCIRWRTRVGSDDSGDQIAIDMSTPLGYRQYQLFEQCALASERLHSMELSVKSASSHVIYELNSAFMANLETLSPTIKFGMAACDTIATSSCSKFVNESYSRIRQMRENGCSSLLTGYAHYLNKSHFEDIFAVYPGGVNDPRSIFGLRVGKIPYDLGTYPMYDLDLQDIIGPEYHNFTVCESVTCEEEANIVKLLYTELSAADSQEMFEDPKVDTLFKKDHFGISQGLVKQLQSMRRRLHCDPEMIKRFFEDNPFLLVRGPKTLGETAMSIKAKLYTGGAAEALRRTSAAIYVGRLAAYRSSKAWLLSEEDGPKHVDLGTMEETIEVVNHKVTYKEFLLWGLSKASKKKFDYKKLRDVIFPQWQSFNVISQFVGKFGPLKTMKNQRAQAVRTWISNTHNYEFNTSVQKMLETAFGLSHESPREDVEEFKKLVGLDLSSIDRVKEQCRERGIRPLDLFYYLTRIVKQASSKKIQVFASGPSTSTMHMTAISIKRFNHYPGMEMVLDAGVQEDSNHLDSKIDSKIDIMKLYSNLSIMSWEAHGNGLRYISDCEVNGLPITKWAETAVRSIKNMRSLDRQSQKVLKFVASQVLNPAEFKEKLVSWRSMNFMYIQKQRRVISRTGDISWVGDLSILVNYGFECYTMNIRGGNHYIEARRVKELDSVFQSMIQMCRVLNIDFRLFFTNRRLNAGDIYLSQDSRRLFRSEVGRVFGSRLSIRTIKSFHYKPLTDFDSFSVQTFYDRKVGCLEVHLKDREGRSASVAHLTGLMFHVPVPGGLKVNEGHLYKGVRLRRLLMNRDWFFNGRLPVMSDGEAIRFLQEDVDMDQLMANTGQVASRIRAYVEARDEVNEEMFSISRYESEQPFGSTKLYRPPAPLDGAKSFDLIMRETLDSLTKESVGLTGESGEGGGLFWADYEDDILGDDQSDQVGMDTDDKLHELLTSVDIGGDMIRALGSAPQGRKKNFGYISTLQSGLDIKNQVLQLFFKGNDISQEDKQSLPHKIVWLLDINDTRQQAVSADSLPWALIGCILDYLSATLSLDKSRVLESCKRRSKAVSAPMTKLQAYLGLVSVDEVNLWGEIIADTYESDTGSDLYD